MSWLHYSCHPLSLSKESQFGHQAVNSLYLREQGGAHNIAASNGFASGLLLIRNFSFSEQRTVLHFAKCPGELWRRIPNAHGTVCSFYLENRTLRKNQQRPVTTRGPVRGLSLGWHLDDREAQRPAIPGKRQPVPAKQILFLAWFFISAYWGLRQELL